MKTLLSLCLIAGLVACGGGGNGAPAPATLPPNNGNGASYDFTTQGTKSSRANANRTFNAQHSHSDSAYLFRTYFPGPIDLTHAIAISLPGGGTYLYEAKQLSSGILPYPTTDTQADKAWDLGWTGKGVKVALVDDYSGQGLPHGVATRAIAFQVAPEADFESASNAHVNLTFNNVSTWAEFVEEMDTRVKPVYDAIEKSGHHIVNNSFGVDPYRGGRTISTADFDAAVQEQLRQEGFIKIMKPITDNTAYNANMLFVFSAGNSGNHCTTGGTNGKNGALDQCRIHAKALLEARKANPDAGDRIIYVGSLADGANTLAPYSFSAGALQNDFIAAHDDIWAGADGAGTSFSTPRVTGAAALVRHKFPNLNGAQLKQVLLQTADDLGDPGPDAVFGYGKLNVLSALSPVGKVTAR